MTTSEVAAYLRLKERKIYSLTRDGAIPCARITGKLLFPRKAIDLWMMRHLEGDDAKTMPAPPVYAGSHDPLLEWAMRESRAGLGLLCNGSSDGIRLLLAGQAQLVGLHVLDPDSGRYNNPAQLGVGGVPDLVMIQWARRVQGLLMAPGNPLAIQALDDLRRPNIRVILRQQGAGAAMLFSHLLRQAGIEPESLVRVERPALNEDDLALEIRDGRADCGLAVEASAHRHGLDFIPLANEHFDLAMRRRDFFEAPVQKLIAFSMSRAFNERATNYGGYDIDHCGEVRYNA